MKNLVLTIGVVLMSIGAASAQKMAHADINAILSVMPENKKINEDLQIYATGLSKRVQDMKAQLDMAVEQFNKVLAAGDTAKAVEIQQQGLELDKQLQQASAQADQQLAQKRGELLQPVLNRIREAMKKVATAKGYEYVLNSVDGSGTSIVLWGPDAADITRAVVDELGIKLEGAEQAPASEEDAKKKKK
ncbi:MAG: OmpH family outer membrane protein [Flavobacteriales bacterium]|nr:OmpH family outer membrane protein [Flavobacteriales bacterium]MCB9204288.1 OmpH family outer membrane protein [Flavobacteriales bacterium]